MTSLRNPGSGRPLTVKVGGARGIGGADLLHDLANHARSGALTVVHGGSDGVTRLQERLGRPARFLTSPTGQVSRRTDREDLEAFAMATALVNRTLVEELLARGVSALGLSGLDGALVRRALENLVHNAVVHSPRGAEVTVALDADREGFRLLVANPGPPIPEATLAALAARRDEHG